MRNFIRSFIRVFTAVLVLESVSGARGMELGAPFADHAVLQRDVELPVWGSSKPGAVVTVEFAAQKGTVTAGADGRWVVKLAPLKASAEPAEMSISDGSGGRVVLKNLLVGEVWHASGQSNMEWFVAKSMCSALAQELAKGDVPFGSCGRIRCRRFIRRKRGRRKRGGRRAARRAISPRWRWRLRMSCTRS